MVIAHPITGSPPLPVPPLVLAAVAVLAAALVVSLVRAAPAAGPSAGRVRGRAEPRLLGLTRLVSALLLLVLIAAARLGPPTEVRNLAAVAVTHLLWPLLLTLAVLGGPLLWRAVDPWWALGAAERLLGAPPAPPEGAAAAGRAERGTERRTAGGEVPADEAPPPAAPAADAAPGDAHETGAASPGAPAIGVAPAVSATPAAAAADPTAATAPAGDPSPGDDAAPDDGPSPGDHPAAGDDPASGDHPAPGVGAASGAAAVSVAADAEPEPPSVWPAVLAAAVWAVFLALHAVAILPRPLATVLGAYTLVMVAGCLAVGRHRWLPRAEAVGLVVSWAGLAGRGRLVRWRPPAGAAALLGAVFGGAVFVRFRLGVGWARVVRTGDPLLRHRIGAVAAVLAGAALAYAFERWARRRGAPGSVAAALVPVVVATVLAAGLRRAMVAAQVVPQVATDPFGRGWRLLGDFGERRLIDINPWGTAVQQGLSAALVLLGVVAGAWVVARRTRGMRARDPAAFAVYVAALVAMLAATAR